ncbi:hypothetical protein D3C78_1296500 [compost metagenome]
MLVATRGNLVGDVVDFEQRRAALGFGNECPYPLHAHQQAFGSELTQGAVDGHAAESQLADQFALRRDPVMGRPAAVVDLLDDHLFDPRVQRRRALAHLGNQRGDRRCRHGVGSLCD